MTAGADRRAWGGWGRVFAVLSLGATGLGAVVFAGNSEPAPRGAVQAPAAAELAAPAAVAPVAPVAPDLATRSGDDWPTFLGAGRDARSREVGVRWPAGGPPILWHREIGDGYSAPTVVRGRLFHFDRHGDRARLTALRAETGEELWRSEYETHYEDSFQYSGGPRASPVVDGNRVYVFGVDGRLRCHAVLDGAVLWEHDTQKKYGVVQNFFGIAATPLVWNDLLIVAIGGSPPGQWDIHAGKVKAGDSGIVAFDKATGRERYRTLGELASYSSPVVRTLDGRATALWLGRSGLWAFDPDTGALLASFPFRADKVYSVNAANPVTVGNEIFVSEAYELGGALLRYRGGEVGAADVGGAEIEVIWRDPRRRGQVMANHWNTAVHHDGHLYGSSGETSGEAALNCVDWRTGKVAWSKPGLRRSTLLYVDGRFVVLSEYGEVRLIEASPAAYREVGTAAPTAVVDGQSRPLLRFPAWNPPILARGVLYLRGVDQMVAMELIPQRAP